MFLTKYQGFSWLIMGCTLPNKLEPVSKQVQENKKAGFKPAMQSPTVRFDNWCTVQSMHTQLQSTLFFLFVVVRFLIAQFFSSYKPPCGSLLTQRSPLFVWKGEARRAYYQPSCPPISNSLTGSISPSLIQAWSGATYL